MTTQIYAGAGLSIAPKGEHYVYMYSYEDGIPYYVGKGKNDRMYTHLKEAKKNITKRPSYVRAETKGLLNKGKLPVITKLIDGIGDELACLVEQELISKYGRRDLNTGILTNCTDGGEGTMNVRPEIVQNRIETLLKYGVVHRFKKGIVPHNVGKPNSPEARRKIGDAQRGRVHSQEERAKRSAALKGIRKGTKLPPVLCSCLYCKKEVNVMGGGFTKAHGDNCKMKGAQ